MVLYGDVGYEITASVVSDALKSMGGAEEIHVRLNSFGGDVFEGLTIYKRLSECSAKIVIHVDGIAASIASVIAMAGDEIVMAQESAFMIHDAWLCTAGNASELRQEADRAEAASRQMGNIYVRKTAQPIEMVRGWMAEERYFYAEDALKYGFATSIAEVERLAAKLDKDRHHFKAEVPEEFTASPRMAEAARTIARMRMQLQKKAGA